MAAAVVAGDGLLSKLLLGTIGGLAGYFVGETIVSQATTVPASGDDVFQDWKNLMDSTLGIGVDAAADIVTGGLLWYGMAAGGGLLVEVVVSGIAGGQVFPLVAAVGSGFGLSAAKNLWLDPPPAASMTNVQDCANALACGCAGKSTTDTLSNIASNQWPYFLNPFTMGYYVYTNSTKKCSTPGSMFTS